MKKIYFYIFSILISNLAISQSQTKRCGFNELRQALLEQYPGLEENWQKIEQQIQQNTHHPPKNGSNFVIPVVVHVLYNTNIPASNISDEQILSQINKLNWDFQRMNADTGNTPNSFKTVAADTKISFCLAQRDPDGKWTNGITRTQTNKTQFNINTDDAKFTSQGGKDGWPSDQYLNIWVVPSINGGVLGYATFPGGPANRDGVVIAYRYFGDREQQSNFGKTFSLSSPYDKGRTATHEVGHWLGLYHIWGDDNGACSGSDYVNDTPNQADETYGCPSSPQISCNNGPDGDMFQNYMDYSDDGCMNLFTAGQATRMQTVLSTTRSTILLSQGCVSTSVDDYALEEHLVIFPNPANNFTNIKLSIPNKNNIDMIIYDITGKTVLKEHFLSNGDFEYKINTENLPNGIYWLKISTGQQQTVQRLMIYH